MRQFLRLQNLLFIILVVGSCKTAEDITQYAPIKVYTQDSVLKSISDKKAMIVIAHDDDMCAMSGTISKLNKSGWNIRVLSFPQAEKRNKAHIKACKDILDTVMFFNFNHSDFRLDLDTNQNQARAISRDLFNIIFDYSIVEDELVKLVNEFKPTIIFTLDNEIGVYGHPEHVFISQMVLDLARVDSINPKYIYQSVYTDHMENSINKRLSMLLKKWGYKGDGWEYAKEIYNVDGMPNPTVQINIVSEAKQKMDYLESYNKRERKTIGFYVPAFEEYKAEEYFKIFDREFFRIIKIVE